VAKLRILVADDHEIVRRGTLSLLEGESDLEICGEAVNGRDALDQARATNPDIVILDIGMPSLNGLEAARQILKEFPQTKILILTVHESEQVVREVLDAGARGFILKSDAARDLVAAVDALRKNKTFFTSKVAEMVLDGFLLKGHNPLRGALENARSCSCWQKVRRRRKSRVCWAWGSRLPILIGQTLCASSGWVH
jgi:DNA-binding NarL/FixJ family response regulator